MASEYTPSASQCHTSTCAPWSATQLPEETRETLNVRARTSPGFTTFVVGSLRMSERFSFSSTKYGPSVRAGRTTHDGRTIAAAALVAATAVGAVVEGDETVAGAQAARNAEPPSSARTSRRLRIRPTGRSSSI